MSMQTCQAPACTLQVSTITQVQNMQRTHSEVNLLTRKQLADVNQPSEGESPTQLQSVPWCRVESAAALADSLY